MANIIPEKTRERAPELVGRGVKQSCGRPGAAKKQPRRRAFA